MSVPLTIGSFKNKVDQDRKLSDYHKMLKLQVNLNKQREKGLVMANLYERGVRPAPEPFQSTEDTLMDINKQRNQAISSAMEMLSRSDAIDFVSKYLTTLSVLQEFNHYWDDFHSTIHNTTGSITPSQFYYAWNRFRKTVYDQSQEPQETSSGTKGAGFRGRTGWNKYVSSRQDDKPCEMSQKVWIQQLAREYKK